MAQKIRMTERIFDCIKLLLENGGTYDEISAYLKVSVATVGRVKRSETWEEYKQVVNESYFKKRALEAAAKEKAQKEAEEAKAEAERLAEEARKAESEKINETQRAETTTPVIPDLKMPGGTMSANYQLSRLHDDNKKIIETLGYISRKLAFIVEELTGKKEETT